MTNKERLISLVGFAPPIEAVDGELIDFGVDGDDDYDSGNSVTLKKAAINLMKRLLSTANTSNPTSGLSVTYDRPSLLAAIKALEIEIGVAEVKEPTLTNKSYMW